MLLQHFINKIKYFIKSHCSFLKLLLFSHCKSIISLLSVKCLSSVRAPSLLPMMDVAGIVEAGFHPQMHCNDLSLTHADVVYSTAFRRRGFKQRGPKITVSEALDGSSLSTKTGTSCLFKMSYESTALPLSKYLHSLSIYHAARCMRKSKALS